MRKYSIYSLVILSLSVFSYAFTTNVEVGSVQQDDAWVAPAEAKELQNPFASDDKKSIKFGKAIYKTFCETCHGLKGQGDGPGSKNLDPKPADHTSAKVQGQTDGEIFWKISEGRGFMVAWKTSIKEEQRWHLVNYIRTLKAE